MAAQKGQYLKNKNKNLMNQQPKGDIINSFITKGIIYPFKCKLPVV